MVESVELFEAISHPARIKILKILEKQPTSFASLKRQLDIESSGNLDHHLKKLKQLITVREDGLYGLTDAGKEALLSIKTIELWTETERRKIKPLGKVPKEALILFGLEISTAASIAYFFAMFSPSGYGLVLSAVFALLGFSSALGILAGKRWSWKTTIAKSGLILLGSVISLCYLPLFLKTYQNASPEITQFNTVGTLYAVFAVAEAIALLLALRHPVKDFLGIKYVTRLSRRAILGGVASILSGILTIVLESWNTFSASEDDCGTERSEQRRSPRRLSRRNWRGSNPAEEPNIRRINEHNLRAFPIRSPNPVWPLYKCIFRPHPSLRYARRVFQELLCCRPHCNLDWSTSDCRRYIRTSQCAKDARIAVSSLFLPLPIIMIRYDSTF